MSECTCGSGEDKYPIHDARGIFVTYACSQCETEKCQGIVLKSLLIRIMKLMNQLNRRITN